MVEFGSGYTMCIADIHGETNRYDVQHRNGLPLSGSIMKSPQPYLLFQLLFLVCICLL